VEAFKTEAGSQHWNIFFYGNEKDIVHGKGRHAIMDTEVGQSVVPNAINPEEICIPN